MEIVEMAKAHLNTVQKAILDLEKQKENIEKEITNLSSYLEDGIKKVNEETSSVEVKEDGQSN